MAPKGTTYGGDSINATIEGDVALNKFLKTFPAAVQRRIMKAAVTYSLKPIRKAARSIVRVRSGQLKKAIKSKSKSYAKRGIVWGAVGIDAKADIVIDGKKVKPIKYAHLVERGTKRTKPYPFMERAFNQTRGSVMSGMTQFVRSRLDREAAKVAKATGMKLNK